MSAKVKQSTLASDSRSVTLLKFLKAFLLSARSVLFAFMYPKFVELVYNNKVATFKREVFADIDSIIPSDKRNGQLKILEIGVGPGKMNLMWSFITDISISNFRI